MTFSYSILHLPPLCPSVKLNGYEITHATNCLKVYDCNYASEFQCSFFTQSYSCITSELTNRVVSGQYSLGHFDTLGYNEL